ncbi:C-type lectin domain family 4 member A [Fukomys damarensis]|uniref:C-type lectin domain family 4 member A n=1 Tax=Fukomys damarensis TaxID=885580 RepID=UPI00053FCB38|nr:C-type lectin domain family 4 member A [Fukomys damarensis]
MAAEVTYAELKFKTESKPSDPNSDSPAAPKGKATPQRSNLCFPKMLLVPLLLFILLSVVFTVAFINQVWSCCPKNWKPFSSHCYFYLAKAKSWQESKEHCSSLEAHLVVITSKEEQHFITQHMKTNAAYYVGLSDPHGQRHWQWVDQTPYNESATFWHDDEPSSNNEHCVILNYRGKWGWNDASCDGPQESVCEMTSICLVDTHRYTAS